MYTMIARGRNFLQVRGGTAWAWAGRAPMRIVGRAPICEPCMPVAGMGRAACPHTSLQTYLLLDYFQTSSGFLLKFFQAKSRC